MSHQTADNQSETADQFGEAPLAMIYSNRRALARAAMAFWGVGLAGATGYGAAASNAFDVSPGVERWLSIIYSHWLLASLLVMLLLAGRVVARLPLLRDACLGQGASAAFHMLLGAFASAWLLLGIGLVMPLSTPAAAAYIAVMTIVASLEWRYVAELLREVAEEKPKPQRSSKTRVLVLLLLVVGLVWLLPTWLRTLLPVTDWDSLMYHLPLAQQFVDSGLWHVDPMQEGLTFPGLPHLFFAVLMSLGALDAVMPLNLFISLSVALAAYGMGATHWGKGAGWFAALTMLSTQMFFELAVDVRIDNFLALFCLMGFDAFLRWDRDASKPGWLIVAGMAFGMAMGTKYSAALLIVMVALPVIGYSIARFKTPNARVGIALPLALLCIALPCGYWYARNTVVLGDPLYPRFTEFQYRTPSGELAPLEPALNEVAPPATAEELAKGPLIIKPTHMFDLRMFTNPLGRRYNQRISPFMLFGLLLPLIAFRDRRAWWLFGIAAAYFLIVGNMTYLLRYAAPVIPLFAVAAGIVLARPRSKAWQVVITLLMFAVMAWNTVVQFRDMRGMSMPAYFSGAYSAQEWICHGAMQSTGCWINFINEEISEGRIQSDAKVLMLTESRGFHLTCDYTPDVRDDAAPFLLQIHQAGSEPRALAEHLLAEGYTHIVYNPLRIRWISLNRQRAFPRVKVAVSHLKNLTREFGVIEFVTENDKVTVIRLVADEPVDVAPDDKLEADQSQPVPTGDDQPTASP